MSGIDKSLDFSGVGGNVANSGGAWDLNEDGILSLNEANNWYRTGGGDPITVDASNITFTNVRVSELSRRKAIPINFEQRGPASVGNVYGTLDLQLVGNDQVRILPNEYDFRTGAEHGHPWFGKGLKGFTRNVGTVLGRLNAGNGDPFMINFRGTANLRYQQYREFELGSYPVP